MQNNIFSTFFVGHNLVIIPKVDSTNNYLKTCLTNSTPLPEGTAIMAENQFAGRGQHQNGWHASQGQNLTLSLLLKPTFLSIKRQFLLTQIISLGIVKALKNKVDPYIKIKWPNDIYYRDKKLGGILIENTIQGTSIKNSIIGMGINVNETNFPNFLPNPVSLSEILQTDYDLHTLLSEICSGIEAYYLQLKAGNYNSIHAEYLQNLYRIDEQHEFEINGVRKNCSIIGVSEEGLLKIRSGDLISSYDLKQIKFII